MAYACFNCDKKTVIGTQHRHRPGVAGRQHLRRAPRTPKYFRPNLHNAFVLTGDSYLKVKLCSKCRRQLKKQGRIKVWTKEKEALKQENIKTLEQKIIRKPIEKAPEKPVIKQEKKTEKKTGVKPVKKVTAKKSAVKKVEPVKETISVEDLVGKKS